MKRYWRRMAVVAAGSVALVVVGSTGSATAIGRPAAAQRTDLQLLAGTDPDFGALAGTRALSASPVFAVTGAPLELNVRRVGGTVQVRQNGELRPVHPRSVIQGLPAFFRWKLLRRDGTVVASARVDACPMPAGIWSLDAWAFNSPSNLDPANPTTPDEDPFPPECGDPLTTHAQWGFPSGWAAPIHINVPDSVAVGTYTLIASVNADGGIRETTTSDNQVRMTVDVIDTSSAEFVRQRAAAQQRATVQQQLARRPLQPLTAGSPSGLSPAASGPVDLPDIVPLPSENITVNTTDGSDFLRFNSTVANLGRGPLEVDGFRSGSAQTMTAEQVLFHNNVAVASRPAGSLLFSVDDDFGPEWHFDDFARYQLLDASGKVVSTSGKVAFCMGDTHQIDASDPGFVGLPNFIGFANCFGTLLRSVKMRIDPGWADEYEQTLPPQELDITNLPNGTYRIEILADPDHKLRETTRSNNVSLRTVIIGGVAGARTVTVPPIDGVDTEAAWAAIHLPF